VQVGQQDAGKELLRATNSVDPDMKHWPGLCWQKAHVRLRDFERLTPTGSPAVLPRSSSETYVDEIMRICKHSCVKLNCDESVRCQWRWVLVGPLEPES